MSPYLPPLHSCLSFLIPYIQELPASCARVTLSFRNITLTQVDPLIQSLHLPLPAPSRFSNKVPVLPVTSFHTFLRTHSEHFFHSVTFSTAHKSKCLFSLRSPCLGADLATFHSAFTLAFAHAPSRFWRTFNGILPHPPAPSFQSFVPHFLHSGASCILRESNSFISLIHPKLDRVTRSFNRYTCFCLLAISF
jgi:hypothetical protein